MDYSIRDIIIFALFEYSQYYSYKNLTKLLFTKHMKNLFEFNSKNNNNNKSMNQLINELSGKLIPIVLPQINDQKILEKNNFELIQVLVLSRKLEEDMKWSLNELSHYNYNYNYDKCIKWSFRQLNLLISSFASIAKSDDQFLQLKTWNSFHPTFKDVFYKLKSLKVLSFLAIEGPKLPIDLLTLIINETFLWTDLTIDVSIMQLHSRYHTQYSNYVKDRHSLHTHMREDFIFDLNEVLEFLIRNFSSFIDYLTKRIDKTQIDLIAENSQQLSQTNETSDQFLIEFIAKIAENPSFLSNESQLIEFMNKSFNEFECQSSLMPTSNQSLEMDVSDEEIVIPEDMPSV